MTVLIVAVIVALSIAWCGLNIWLDCRIEAENDRRDLERRLDAIAREWRGQRQ